MKKFILRVSIFSIPAIATIITAAIVFIIFEPNNYFGFQDYRDYKGLPIYRIREFMREQKSIEKDTFIFGDSRFAHFDRQGVLELEGDKQVSNLAFGGASLKESIDLFWWAVSRKKPKNVVFGTSFYNFNAKYSYDRIPKALLTAEDAYLYFTDMSYAQATLNRIIGIVFPKKEQEDDLSAYAKIIYSVCENYSLNYEQLERLKEVSKYCKENDVKLYFVLPPAHLTIWELVIDPLQLEPSMNTYKNELITIGILLDLETEKNIFTTSYSSDFGDGFHLNDFSNGYAEYKKTIYNLIN